MSPQFILFKILLKSVITVCIIANVAEGQCSRSSLPCEYTCHCTDKNPCGSAVIGQCGNPLSCERGWSGPKCQRENVVLDTPAQLGSSSIKGTHWIINAFKGDLATQFESDEENSPYLWVKLKSIQRINRLNIVTSGTDSSLISGFRIHVYNSESFTNPLLCYEDPKTSDQEVHDITCEQPLVGQYVRITVPKVTSLILRQMEIYRCADYWFGDNCNIPCNCQKATDICNRVTGQCDSGCPIGYAEPDCQVLRDRVGDVGNKCNGKCTGGCAAGYTGDVCKTVCPAGSYGQGCTFGCGNCLTVNVCNKVNGRCSGGCTAGYRGGTCNTLCPAGSYGQGCKFLCGNCLTVNVCNNVDGRCSGGCAAGYKGYTCKTVCPAGSYGQGCTFLCGNCQAGIVCNDVDGGCTGGCAAGYTGDRCKTACFVGYYGQACTARCGHCLAGNVCNNVDGRCSNGNCADGYTGDTCKTVCPVGYYGQGCTTKCGHCLTGMVCNNINGRCSNGNCAAGYKGYTCKTVCPVGYYGERCIFRCGNCLTGKFCNNVDGRCSNDNCAAGYKGYTCNTVCPVGYYGQGCTARCGNCLTGMICNNIDGRCSNGNCAAGYKGYTCNTACSVGYYGLRCTRRCNCLNGNACNNVDGRCSGGKCADGFTGDTCNTVCRSGYYGPGCTEQCGHCQAGNVCYNVDGGCSGRCTAGYTGNMCKTECADGFYGEGCTTQCGKCLNGESCNKVNGRCPSGCDPGYRSDTCTKDCHDEYYGQNCSFSCGNCLDKSPCDKINGSCLNGCNIGFDPPQCAKDCNDGFYGSGCSKPCGKCINRDVCNKTTGHCPGQCSAGYDGTLCQTECTNSTFGPACREECHCFNGTQCDITSGECGSGGCASGYAGESCQRVLSQMGPDPNSISDGTIGGIGGAAAGLVVLLVIVLIVVLTRRRKRKPQSNGEFLNEGYPLSEENEPAKQDEEVTIDVQDAALYANTMDVRRSPTAVYLTNLIEYVSQGLKAETPYEKEFLKLPKQLIKSTDEANKEHNVTKCRYRGILPYDETRVVLETLDDGPTTDFVNASYVKGHGEENNYIAAQGTTKYNMDDFWRMIWQQQTGKIVMLSNLVENGKTKVLQYWPDKDVANYGHISVEVTETEHHVDHCVRTLRVTNGSHVRNIKQFHFLAWPDHDVPRDTVGVIELREKVNRTASRLSGPIVVHCSAGVGRTGTYIAFGNLMKQMESENEVDIFQTVVTLRNQRTQMVQTKEQYAFLHRLFRDGYLCRGSGLTTEQIASLEMGSPYVINRIQDEYEVLGQINSLDLTTANGDDSNENGAVSTDQGNRFWFNTNVPGGNDFIEVTKFPVEHGGSPLLATKIPDTEAKLDFWRLVYEQNCSSLILLNKLSQNLQYWPNGDTPLKIGPFDITLVSETAISNIMTVRQLSVVSSEQPEFADPHVLQHICFNGWSKGDKGVPSADHMLSLKEQVMGWEGEDKSGSVIVHCRDGIERSGLYAVCDFLLDRLKTESNINVLLSVKRFRTICPGSINKLAHYRFCYQVLKAYLEKFNTYANYN